jgi:hypothetical protein
MPQTIARAITRFHCFTLEILDEMFIPFVLEEFALISIIPPLSA